jgi:hypothetical protein
MDMIFADVFSMTRRRKRRTLIAVLPPLLVVTSLTVLAVVLPVQRPGGPGSADRAAAQFAVFAPSGAAVCACGQFRADDTGRRPDEGLVAFGVYAYLMPPAFASKIKSLSAVRDAVPLLEYRFRDPNDQYLYTVRGIEITPGADAAVIKGRFLDKGDRGGVLLERGYARARRLEVGDVVRIAGEPFTVLGIIESGVHPAQADISMPYAEAERIIGRQLPYVPLANQANIILVETKDAAAREEAVREVKSIYPDLIISLLSPAKRR